MVMFEDNMSSFANNCNSTSVVNHPFSPFGIQGYVTKEVTGGLTSFEVSSLYTTL